MSSDHYGYPHGAYPMAAPGAQPGAHASTGQGAYMGQHTQGMGMGGAGYGWQTAHPGHGPTAAYGAYPAPPSYGSSSGSFFNLGNDRFVKGLLIGAAAAYLLTNESVQRTAIKGVVKAWGLLQGGIEEVKERFQDAEAEIQAAEAAKARGLD